MCDMNHSPPLVFSLSYATYQSIRVTYEFKKRPPFFTFPPHTQKAVSLTTCSRVRHDSIPPSLPPPPPQTTPPFPPIPARSPGRRLGTAAEGQNSQISQILALDLICIVN